MGLFACLRYDVIFRYHTSHSAASMLGLFSGSHFFSGSFTTFCFPCKALIVVITERSLWTEMIPQLRDRTTVRKGENRVQYVTSGSVSAQPTPPHLPQTTYQSG